MKQNTLCAASSSRVQETKTHWNLCDEAVTYFASRQCKPFFVPHLGKKNVLVSNNPTE